MVRAARFLTGLVMVVVGVSLAAPVATRLVGAIVAGDAAGAAAPVGDSAPSAAAWAGSAPSEVPTPAPGAGAYCIPDPRAELPATGAAPPVVAAPDPSPAADVVAAAPAPNAAPLPLPPADLSLAVPAFAANYRSTLDAPPPPLLDVDAASPLVIAAPAPAIVPAGYSPAADAARRPMGVVSAGGGEATVAPWQVAAGPVADSRAVATHVVRDGDELTSLAARYYGHPGAAEAIWNANRDRLSDPAVLPIGLELRLPASWTPPSVRAAAAAAVLEPGTRPQSVRVGPGETFESLARRFYGDPGMAARLWEANRDRLRDPALLTAGTELRLP